MKWYHLTDPALSLEGLALSDREGRRYWRLPADVIDQVNSGVSEVAKFPSGARVRFATDSRRIALCAVVGPAGYIKNVGAIGKCGLAGYVDGEWHYVVYPTASDAEEMTGAYDLDGKMHEHTVYLPLFTPLYDLMIGLDDGAQVKPPRPYAVQKPLVFYGSSITNGASATHAGNAYVSIVCRRLDASFLNLGFSGSARGEESIARYIAGLDMSLFVMDYDHNAPDAAHLEATHERFFRIVREAQPDLPIIMVSKPDFDTNPGSTVEVNARRREIIRRTYQNALARGDRRVWFVDGETFFGDRERFDCAVDGCHPTDLGFRRMADVLEPVLREALGLK